MGRGRGKAKKTTVTSHDDPGSGEEEKIPAQKRRGRPQKSFKDEVDDEEVKVEEVDSENKDSSITSAVENGKKRKRSSPSKEKQSPMKEENGVAPTLVSDISTKPIGFRHIGSRRKNKPRRAAEVGVEC